MDIPTVKFNKAIMSRFYQFLFIITHKHQLHRRFFRQKWKCACDAGKRNNLVYLFSKNVRFFLFFKINLTAIVSLRGVFVNNFQNYSYNY